MKKKESKLEYKSKGEIVDVHDDVIFITKIVRDVPEDDNIDLLQFSEDLKDFCSTHQGKEVKIKLSAVAETE